jgi:hypothetical protein
LSGSWTSYSAAFAGTGVINQASGHAQVGTDGATSISLVTGGGCTFPADQYAQVGVDEADGNVMPLVRASSSGNGYGAYVTTSGVTVLRLTGGGGASIGSNSCTYVSGNTYKISSTGSTITVFQNGTSCGTATDSTYPTGLPGLFMDNSGSAANNTQARSFQAN